MQVNVILPDGPWWADSITAAGKWPDKLQQLPQYRWQLLDKALGQETKLH